MLNEFSRTRMLLGDDAMARLAAARVAVFGVGGVGGYVVEALARSGVGALELIDNDTVSLTNINRQIIALHSTVGMPKVDAARARVLDICPQTQVIAHRAFFTPETAAQFDFTQYSYVVDAIDTVSGKIELAVRAHDAGVPILSCMGAGNKLDPTAFEVTDISKTSVDPLARVMRRELRARGIEHLRVVYSTEPPRTPKNRTAAPVPGQPRPKDTPGSSPWVPSAAGLLIAAEVVARVLGEEDW